jgi:hypothetical protein
MIDSASLYLKPSDYVILLPAVAVKFPVQPTSLFICVAEAYSSEQSEALA